MSCRITYEQINIIECWGKSSDKFSKGGIPAANRNKSPFFSKWVINNAVTKTHIFSSKYFLLYNISNTLWYTFTKK